MIKRGCDRILFFTDAVASYTTSVSPTGCHLLLEEKGCFDG